MLLSEVMERLQWKAFLEAINGDISNTHLTSLFYNLRKSIAMKDRQESTNCVEDFMHTSDDLFAAFDLFRTENAQKSETFKFWDHFIELVRLLRNLVRADREGNWNLHLLTVQSILPYFASFNNINYFRWCSVYLEDMKLLPKSAPDVFEQFSKGKFVVKQTPGNFKAVGVDQCLEQTINRSQKGSGGIIGSSRKKDFVAEWEIIYHEMMGVSNLHQELSGTKQNNHELILHHEFTNAETCAREKNVIDMVQFIQHHENPFKVGPETEYKLHNIITQEVMTDDIRLSIINVKELGEEMYKVFRQERILTKKKRIHEPIHKNDIKTFNSINTNQMTRKNNSKTKKFQKLTSGHRYLEICQARGNSIKELFKYDLIESCYLFEDSGLIKKSTKSVLCHELEKFIDVSVEYSPSTWCEMNTVWLVDVMANIRKINIRGLKTFEHLCNSFLRMISMLCSKATRVDFVFDSYVETSVKQSERIRRYTTKSIEICSINEDTPLPANMDTFWSSNSNKCKFQTLLRKYITCNASNCKFQVVVSGTMQSRSKLFCTSIMEGECKAFPELDIDIEEADVRLIPHALHATRQGLERCVLLSGDTDVMVLGLHFFKVLESSGLKELWIRLGNGNSTRLVPLHIIARNTPALCRVIIALHVLTGCDLTSKVGTKRAALKANPELYLTLFGNSLDEENRREILALAERYLVKVCKPSSSCETMDELRYSMYRCSKSINLKDLPPTSASIKNHILRCLYVSFKQMNCLKQLNINPTDFGYEETGGLISPCRVYNPVPSNLAQTCSCKDCSTKRCACRIAGVQCCTYCACKNTNKSSRCKNSHCKVTGYSEQQ
ncbi:hypothetical protein ACF0H5_003503 [Mactra antiquata]